MRQVNTLVLNAANTASQNGSQIDSNQLLFASFQAVFGDATAAGTFKLQASNDVAPIGYSGQTFTATNWTDIPNATASIASGASSLITLTSVPYRWVRAVYTRSSGGSTTVKVSMLAQGA